METILLLTLNLAQAAIIAGLIFLIRKDRDLILKLVLLKDVEEVAHILENDIGEEDELDEEYNLVDLSEIDFGSEDK